MRIHILTHLLLGCLIFIMLNPMEIQAQTTGKKQLQVGELWQEDEHIPTGGWEKTFIWPGNHWRRSDPSENILTNGTARDCGLSFGLKDWTDWKNNFYSVIVGGVHNTHLVHPIGGRFGAVNHTFLLYVRQPPPTLIVDGELQPPRQAYDELDPNLVCDASLLIRWSQDVGLTCQQTYYAYAAYPFDSYMFLDFIITNSGNVNRNEATVELKNQVLHDVCFNFMVQPLVTFEGGRQSPHTGTENSCDDWVEYYGENYLDYLGAGTPVDPAGDPNADSLRIFFVWDGDNNKSPGRDDTGEPDFNEGFQEQTPGMGRLLSSQYLGFGVLHADKAHDDESNDLSQPISTVWRPGDNRFSSCDEAYDYFFTERHMKSPQEMGYTEPNDPVHVARPNPYVGIGPYEMPFGSDIHFNFLVAVNGLNHDMCNSVGLSWWTQWKGGSGFSDEEKNWWCATSRDSLFKYFGQATKRYFRNIENGRHPYDAPEAPIAPDLTVTAGEKSVILEWSDVSDIPDHDTGVIDFAGYRVYRSLSRNDTTFQMIWECGGESGNPIVTRFVDENVQRGFAYYYYVSAYDDGTQNWEQPGRSLESGKYWNMMLKNRPVHPFMSSKPVPDLDNIKVVPNPYNDKSVKYNWPGEENKLLFINIPLKCTLKIFTLTGDLVKTIEHDDGTTEQAWNQVSDDNQLIYSGVYIYHIQSDMGNRVGKFVVIRSSRIEDD
ncbi:T9SS type A sorting domain-containing protein [candidate division KSB1 bacterium]|nr:T9SS type A sorting domain-containing protein [candidate division KSB1 bacterium]